jgi:hypothetical protein
MFPVAFQRRNADLNGDHAERAGSLTLTAFSRLSARRFLLAAGLT